MVHLVTTLQAVLSASPSTFYVRMRNKGRIWSLNAPQCDLSKTSERTRVLYRHPHKMVVVPDAGYERTTQPMNTMLFPLTSVPTAKGPIPPDHTKTSAPASIFFTKLRARRLNTFQMGLRRRNRGQLCLYGGFNNNFRLYIYSVMKELDFFLLRRTSFFFPL
jgi:hypothetical protein